MFAGDRGPLVLEYDFSGPNPDKLNMFHHAVRESNIPQTYDPTGNAREHPPLWVSGETL